MSFVSGTRQLSFIFNRNQIQLLSASAPARRSDSLCDNISNLLRFERFVILAFSLRFVNTYIYIYIINVCMHVCISVLTIYKYIYIILCSFCLFSCSDLFTWWHLFPDENIIICAVISSVFLFTALPALLSSKWNMFASAKKSNMSTIAGISFLPSQILQLYSFGRFRSCYFSRCRYPPERRTWRILVSWRCGQKGSLTKIYGGMAMCFLQDIILGLFWWK